MGREIDMERRFSAEEAYVVDGLTFERVAELTGIAVNTLKNWSATEDWPGKRAEYRKSLSTIRANTVRLRSRLLEKALDTLNPQDVYAISAIEGVAAKMAAAQEKAAPPCPVTTQQITSPAQAVEALEMVVQNRIAMLLGRPDTVSLASLQELQKAMKLLDEMRAKYAPEIASKTDKGLSAQTIESIREQIGL